MAHTGEDTAAKVLKQVEFYFSNSNLPKDKFLLAQTQANDEGWVPIATVASFKRMKQLTEDLALITEALRQSKELLEVSEDGKSIRRKIPIPEELDITERSIYAKEFPADSSIESIGNFFSKFGRVLSVRLRRRREGDKQFKGSVFVEFSTVDEAKNVAAQQLEVDGKPLIVQMKQAYLDKKKGERAEGKGKKRKADEAADGEDKEEEPVKNEFQKDLLVHFDELKEASREDLKAALEAIGCNVKYVDYSRGQTFGFVRLGEGSAADAVKKLQEKGTDINGTTPKVRALGGVEEEEYWKNVNERVAAAKAQRKKRKVRR